MTEDGYYQKLFFESEKNLMGRYLFFRAHKALLFYSKLFFKSFVAKLINTVRNKASAAKSLNNR